MTCWLRMPLVRLLNWTFRFNFDGFRWRPGPMAVHVWLVLLLDSLGWFWGQQWMKAVTNQRLFTSGLLVSHIFRISFPLFQNHSVVAMCKMWTFKVVLWLRLIPLTCIHLSNPLCSVHPGLIVYMLMWHSKSVVSFFTIKTELACQTGASSSNQSVIPLG